MKSLAAWVLVAVLAQAGPARSDVVAEWNQHAFKTEFGHPGFHARALAMVHLAMFDAINAVSARYRPYRAQTEAPSGASPEAAAAGAAHAVLVRLRPEQAAAFDAALAATLAALPDRAAQAKGLELGRRVAAAIHEERENDGTRVVHGYRPATAPGVYVPTPLPAGYGWGAVKPWTPRATEQFRPGPPYALTSQAWARDFNEVKRLGGKTGSARTAEQTAIAQFWTLTGPATYNAMVHQLALARRLDLTDTARLFALVYLAAVESDIAVFDAKYAYHFWRPITAIRNGDRDSNEATERDALWEPLIPTPLHPEYPCAHCITEAATLGVLIELFGDGGTALTLTHSAAAMGLRRFERLSDAITEVIDARVYAGLHFRESGTVGAEMGRRVAAHVVKNMLVPVPLQ